MRTDAMLLTGIFMSPIAWFLSLEANFVLAPLACSARNKVALYVVSGIALGLSALGAIVSLSRWQAMLREPANSGDGAKTRQRAMAFGGLGLGILFFLVILAQTIPNLLLAGCE